VGGGICWSREGGGFVGITPGDRERWGKAYPAVDVDRQLAAMHEWLLAHPREAVKRNWLRFITGWLTRQQERGGDVRTERRRDGPTGTGTQDAPEPAWKREKRDAKRAVREAVGG
jgi:hypothetical protein